MSLFKFPGIERTTPEFRAALVALGSKLDIDPNAIAAVMSIESGFHPAARNPAGGAVGLIQWMPSTLKLWGLEPTTVAAMTAVEQLTLVDRFFHVMARGVHDPGTLYMLTFLPKYAMAAEDFVLGREGDYSTRDGLQLHRIWAQNMGLDTNKDGEITVAEVKALARGRYTAAQKAGFVDPEEEPPTDPDIRREPLTDPGADVPFVEITQLDWDTLRKERDAFIREREDREREDKDK